MIASRLAKGTLSLYLFLKKTQNPDFLHKGEVRWRGGEGTMGAGGRLSACSLRARSSCVGLSTHLCPLLRGVNS